jgi:hypothetical protein
MFLLVTLSNTVIFFFFLALQVPTRLNYLPRPINGSDIILTLVCNCEML